MNDVILHPSIHLVVNCLHITGGVGWCDLFLNNVIFMDVLMYLAGCPEVDRCKEARIKCSLQHRFWQGVGVAVKYSGSPDITVHLHFLMNSKVV